MKARARHSISQREHPANATTRRACCVTGDYLSYAPDGIMFRKGEPQLAAVVERAFRKLGSHRDLVPLYNKWFTARLPTGERPNVPISLQLGEAFKAMDDSAGASN
jgi:glutamate/aspartate transport system substrate-binding protein